MIGFDITHRWTRECLYHAQINCEESAPISLKTRLAVSWILENRYAFEDVVDFDDDYFDFIDVATILRNADLRSGDLSGLDFSTFDLSGADFSRATLRKSVFKNCELKKTNFHAAAVDQANFAGSDLNQAIFDYAGCYKTNFEGCNLAYASFMEAHVTGMTLVGARLDKTNFEGSYIIRDNGEAVSVRTNPLRDFGSAGICRTIETVE